MPRLIVDSQVRAKLYNLSERLEMCDEKGQVLGVYVPLAEPSTYRTARVPATSDELQQSEREEGRPLEEILRDLENRA